MPGTTMPRYCLCNGMVEWDSGCMDLPRVQQVFGLGCSLSTLRKSLAQLFGQVVGETVG